MAEEKKKSVSELVTELTDKLRKLRGELIELENQFNTKKEEFVKLQGALEAFNYVKGSDIVI